eukprot:CAMPEP_0205801214 /NCGR_PEP_ID=MMETSP0205-20121125/3144_1 /ASSEMBLY_ACC=CAM_ASM_000278 /TAXON_ID=36767 /ORGANISM="Euplotes focardii, Strain TN1" /LENGTH=274 /DNA_ID=CAMNT_0053065621 /DNA_START=137 /DNA_END=962 /DNA_ORIENTATION=+
MPLHESSGGYPDMEGLGAGGYPSLAPMTGYPSIGGDLSTTVPTSSSKATGEIGYPSASHSTGPTAFNPSATAYPNIAAAGAGGGYPSFSNPMSVPSAPLNTQTYKEIGSTAYPSMSGVSATKFHEEVKKPSSKKVKNVAYPNFDDNGNIDCCDEIEPVSSTQMPYGTKSIPKPDRELTVEESCLFCNLLTLFVNYEFDESNVLTPSHVRQALDSITGSNGIQGFSEGSMACAQETFEEILRYLHREFIKPNYFEKYCTNPDKLKKKEEEYEETG